MDTNDDAAFERARKHVEDVRDFAYHAMVYVVVNLLLVILDRRAGTHGSAVLGLDWAYWPILGWGIGLAGHWISVVFDDQRIYREVERERDRSRRS